MGKLKGRGMPTRLRIAPSRLQRPDREAMAPRKSPNRPIHSKAWRKARAAFLREHIQAAAERGDVLRCAQTGVPLIGKDPAPNSPVVDHIVPDRGDLTLFWDRANWQVVSKAWHDSVKQSLERRDLA